MHRRGELLPDAVAQRDSGVGSDDLERAPSIFIGPDAHDLEVRDEETEEGNSQRRQRNRRSSSGGIDRRAIQLAEREQWRPRRQPAHRRQFRAAPEPRTVKSPLGTSPWPM